MDLIDAVQNGDIDRVRELLDSGVNPNIKHYFNDDSPLISASFDGHTEIVKLLLESGADPNIGYRHGYTPLIFASKKGHSDVVRLLLEHGADINIRGKYGNTPLILASRGGHSDIVRLLLERGADINIQNDYGNTPLMSASRGGHSDIVKLLLENGADPTIKQDNFDETTAYDEALDNGNMEIARLIQYHIDLLRAQQNLAFMKYFLDRDDLDIDATSKIFSNERSYNPGVHRRIRDEQRRNMILEEENNRIADYLNTIEQYGSGKRSGKHSKKRNSKKRNSKKKKSKTKKKY